jgi:hypothetical protein
MLHEPKTKGSLTKIEDKKKLPLIMIVSNNGTHLWEDKMIKSSSNDLKNVLLNLVRKYLVTIYSA